MSLWGLILGDIQTEDTIRCVPLFLKLFFLLCTWGKEWTQKTGLRHTADFVNSSLEDLVWKEQI